MRRPQRRPLDRITSLKVKLGVLVGLSILTAAVVAEVGSRSDVPIWLSLPVTVMLGLYVTQVLARGMISPLRQMTVAAEQMARGDYTTRVQPTTATDEVGRLTVAFNAMAGELAAADEQRRALIATVSHELRTPLAAQRAVLENLADGVVPADRPALEAVLGQSERLSGLVEAMLDLARLEGGVTRLDLQPVDVADLVAACVAEARLAGRPVEFRVDADPGLSVQADPVRLRQVLDNLLDNASRHTPPGGQVRVRTGPAGADDWFLEVGDDGEGIAADRRELVFDRFGTTAAASGGTGLGLAIARGVCDLHGGSIRALTPPPGTSGALIRVQLPRAPGRRPGDTPPEENQVSTPDNPANPEPDKPVAAGETATGDTAAPGQPLPPPAAGPATGTLAPPVTAPYAPGAHTPGMPPPWRPNPGGAIDSLFGRYWPEQGLGARPGLLAAGLAAGLAAAFLVPGHDIGVGVALAFVISGAVMAWPGLRRRDWWTAACYAVGAVLVSMIVLRASDAVASLCLLGAIGLASVGSAGGRTVLALVLSPLWWALASIRGLPLLARTLAATRRVPRAWAMARTAVITLVLLLVFGGLFASADAVFGSWVGAVVPDLSVNMLVLRGFIAVAVSGVVLAGVYLTLNQPAQDRVRIPLGRRLQQAWEWVVPVGAVIAVFVVFMAAQSAAMWGGHEYLMRTTGLGYGDYVHQGFGQLTVATVLTLGIVALVAGKVSLETARDRMLVRGVLGALCLLTLAVVCSALYRMALYQQALGYTKLRLFVDGFELWLGLIVVFVMIAGIRMSGAWVPRAAILTAGLLLAGFGLMNPDVFVANRNIDRYEVTGKLDQEYLGRLGADATPVILTRLQPHERECVYAYGLRPDAEKADPPLGWNLGRARERAALAGQPLPPAPDSCYSG